MTHVIAGALLGFSLIVAIGPQNAFVLRQAIRRDRVAVVATLCILSDWLLIAAGTVGIGVLITQVRWLFWVLRIGGAAYLLWFAWRSFLSAWHPSGLTLSGPASARSVVAATLAITWLNPHVYLDTVVMLGSLANHEGPTGRWWFALGAGAASLVWFAALAGAGRALAAPLARPSVWRIIDAVIGVIMVVMAARLLLG